MPTYAHDIAHWVEALLSQYDHLDGVFHLTHTGEPASWWSYGMKVLEGAHSLGLLESCAKITPTKMQELQIFKVPRPIHTAMTPRRLQKETEIEVRDWSEAVRERLVLMLSQS